MGTFGVDPAAGLPDDDEPADGVFVPQIVTPLEVDRRIVFDERLPSVNDQLDFGWVYLSGQCILREASSPIIVPPGRHDCKPKLFLIQIY